MYGLTKKQLQIVDAYLKHRAYYVKSPTISWLSNQLGIARSTVYKHLIRLERKGYLENNKPTDKLLDELVK